MRPRLAQLHQSGATDGQVPVWDAAAGLWVPGAGAGGGSSTEHVTQWWEIGGSGATVRTLAYAPTGVPVVTLNGLAQRESVEWTISGSTLSVLAGMSAEAGDVLQVTYHADTSAPAAESTTSTVTVVND